MVLEFKQKNILIILSLNNLSRQEWKPTDNEEKPRSCDYIKCVGVYTCVYVYVCTCVYIHVYMCCMCVSKCMCTCVYIHVCVIYLHQQFMRTGKPEACLGCPPLLHSTLFLRQGLSLNAELADQLNCGRFSCEGWRAGLKSLSPSSHSKALYSLSHFPSPIR